MDATPFPDFASSIRYALTSRPAPGGGVDIVLDLFRGAVPALTRTIASVRTAEAALLLERCRRHLERFGAHAVAPAAVEPDPDGGTPGAGFDWLFAG